MELIASLLKALIKPLSEAFKTWFIYRAGRDSERLKNAEAINDRVKSKNEIKSVLRTRDAKSINRVLNKWLRDK
jgi:hypothetical protein